MGNMFIMNMMKNPVFRTYKQRRKKKIKEKG